MLEQFETLSKALLAGCIVGVLFSAIKLPLPAPKALAGIFGILGIYLGYKGWDWLAQTYLTK